MDFSALIQLAATFFAAWGAFGAYRVRDNERAAALSVIQNEIRHIIKRLDRMEDERKIGRIERKKSKESA